jgi:hypothetical protein
MSQTHWNVSVSLQNSMHARALFTPPLFKCKLYSHHVLNCAFVFLSRLQSNTISRLNNSRWQASCCVNFQSFFPFKLFINFFGQKRRKFYIAKCIERIRSATRTVSYFMRWMNPPNCKKKVYNTRSWEIYGEMWGKQERNMYKKIEIKNKFYLSSCARTLQITRLKSVQWSRKQRKKNM